MSPTEIWFDALEDICIKFEQVIVTEYEFLDSLKKNILNHPNCPIENIHFQITCPEPFGETLLGDSQLAEPSYIYTHENFDKYGAYCKIKIWRRTADSNLVSFDASQLNDYLLRLIKSFWKPDLRGEKSRLISLQVHETKQLFENTLAAWMEAPEIRNPFMFFCDLDGFKKVNDTYDQQIGDGVILEFGAIINKKCSPYAIVIHRTGDEFIVLHRTPHSDEALTLLKTIMQAVSSYNFESIDKAIEKYKSKGFEKPSVEIGISGGIIHLQDNESISIADVEQRAEKALKPPNSSKQRGKARFEQLPQISLPENDDFNRNTALCLIKSCIHSSRPFESPWLNLISSYSYEVLSKSNWQNIELQNEIDLLINWVQPEFNNNTLRTSLDNTNLGDGSPVFSKLDVVLAISHGIFRAGFYAKEKDLRNKKLEVIFGKQDEDISLNFSPDNIVLFSFGNNKDVTNLWNLGGFVYTEDNYEEAIDTRRALLIKIGHRELNIPNSIFADEIIVDDRPTAGGGLPDFWEATIAKLIAQINININIESVYLLGEHKYGAQTIKKLNEIDSLKDNIDEISYKTQMPHQSIDKAVDRLKDKIHFPENGEELIRHLSQVLLNPFELKSKINSSIQIRGKRFLNREADIGEMSLGKYDGCRVKTIAEAFPIVLDIARKPNDKALKIVDQAGEEFIELVDFKVYLTSPKSDLIPAFYQKEQDSLDSYFRKEFLADDGLFGSIFKKTGQLDAVMNHLVDASINVKHQFSTRRAVLVVPNVINPEEEFAPLGLISVRIIPRFIQNRIILHTSYTWRTVEALVGFPYSLYGSVKYSQYLTDKFRERLPENQKRNLDMGTVSYIAHSLHFFLDEHRQNIARRIIEDASN